MPGESPSDLSDHSFAERLLELSGERANGELELVRGRARKRFGLLDGAVVSVDSSLPSESLCARLRDSGDLDAAGVARAEAFARERETTHAAALTSLRLVDPKRLFHAIRERVASSAREAMLWSDGTCHFDESSVPPEQTRAFQCDILPIVHEALRASWPADRIAMDLFDRFPSHAAVRTGAADRLRSVLEDNGSALRLLSLLNGERTLEAIIGDIFSQPEMMSAVWIADRAGLLRYTAGPKTTAEPGGLGDATDLEIEIVAACAPARDVAAAATEKRDASTPDAGGEAEEIRKEILAMHDRLDDCDHYEILGVASDAAADAIKKAYFQAAKRYHPDKLVRLGLADVKHQSSEVFGAIAEAHELLSDAERRQQYDEALASGGATDDVDLTRIAQAESYFRKGQILVKMGDFRGAAELLETAIELWPDESIYQATLGWARFRKTPPDNGGAAEALRYAVRLDPESAQAHHWLAQVLRALGDVNDAAQHAARARQLDPKAG